MVYINGLEGGAGVTKVLPTPLSPPLDYYQAAQISTNFEITRRDLGEARLNSGGGTKDPEPPSRLPPPPDKHYLLHKWPLLFVAFKLTNYRNS